MGAQHIQSCRSSSGIIVKADRLGPKHPLGDDGCRCTVPIEDCQPESPQRSLASWAGDDNVVAGRVDTLCRRRPWTNACESTCNAQRHYEADIRLAPALSRSKTVINTQAPLRSPRLVMPVGISGDSDVSRPHDRRVPPPSPSRTPSSRAASAPPPARLALPLSIYPATNRDHRRKMPP